MLCKEIIQPASDDFVRNKRKAAHTNVVTRNT